MGRRQRLAGRAAAGALALSAIVGAAPSNNAFEVVGNSGVSAQQMFLSTPNRVVIIDKTEGNGNGLNVGSPSHPAYAVEYDVDANTVRALDVVTNAFCAGGNVLGDGRWLNVGGNQAIGAGGINWPANAAPYYDGDGGPQIRVWRPCTDKSCEWRQDTAMTTRRWYPTLETLQDGSAIIIGGCDFGGYVNDASQNNPTFEFYPSRGAPIGLNLLLTTLPANLFPHTFLLPSGNLLIQANLGTEIFDVANNIEHPLPNVPHSVRTYPGSAATAMMPLTPANNWTATVLFCGGTNLQPDQWVTTWNIAAYPADNTCVSITPDVSTAWVDEGTLPEGRSMGNMIALPDGRYVVLNGQLRGTAGYGNTSWAIGQSFGDGPVLSPLYYDRSRPQGQRFYRDGMGNSTVPRMYHSSALLLPDGSIFSSGSNPNADFISAGTQGYPYPTEYRVERFYPDYYTATRPKPTGLPTNLTYGGASFDVTLTASDVGTGPNASSFMVSVIRPGFSTHAMNMGQRFVQLNNTVTLNTDGSATLHVSQVPPNPAILAPGPAYIFVVVNGVPSIGQQVMVGSGAIGTQTVNAAAALPPSSGFNLGPTTNNNAQPTNGGGAIGSTSSPSPVSPGSGKGAAVRSRSISAGAGAGLLALLVLASLL